MAELLPFIMPVLAVIAFVAWLVAAYAYIMVLRAPRKASFFTLVFSLGWFRMERVREILEPDAYRYVELYMKAFVAFFLCVMAAIALAALAAPELNSPTGAS